MATKLFVFYYQSHVLFMFSTAFSSSPYTSSTPIHAVTRVTIFKDTRVKIFLHSFYTVCVCVCVFFFFRAHRNDMENIFPFLFLGAIYSMTGPSYAVARLHFLVFFLGRVVHSIAYLLALKAPTRSFAYVIAQVPCVSMAIQILMDVASFA